MSITVTEHVSSRRWTDGETRTVDLIYRIDGSEDDVAVKQAMYDASPVTHDNLIRLTYSVEHIGEGVWEGTVRYGRPSGTLLDQGDPQESFDTSGGTEHVTQSKQTINSYVASGTAPDYKGAVGVTPNGVEGVDIITPRYAFSERWLLSPNVVTASYKGVLFDLTGQTNNGAFKGLQAGECLFLGAVGTTRDQDSRAAVLTTRTSASAGDFTLESGHGLEVGDVVKIKWTDGARREMSVTAVDGALVTISGGSGDALPAESSSLTVIQTAWEIEFRFAGSPNQTGLEVGDITGISKKGWEYLWIRYEDQADATAKALVKRPRAVYIERMYDEGDFSTLLIGV